MSTHSAVYRDKLTHCQVELMFRGAPVDENGFNYYEFTKILKHGAKDKEADVQQDAE